jgi:hypothetical protein
MNNGFIKIHRKITEWEWYDDTNTFRLFFHCIFKANWKDNNYRGTLVKRGSFLTSLKILADETGLTVRQIRTCLKRLESTHEVTSERTAQGTVIQVVKYNDYQDATHEATSKRQASDKQATTNKERKERKEDIEQRKKNFQDLIRKYVEANPNKYSQLLYKDFYSYWSEHGINDKKMRFEKQDSFSLPRRLSTWKSRDKEGKYDQPKEKKVVHHWNRNL